MDLETYQEPDITENDVIFVLARLDFRSASRGTLEPLLEELLKIPKVKVIRVNAHFFTDGYVFIRVWAQILLRYFSPTRPDSIHLT